MAWIRLGPTGRALFSLYLPSLAVSFGQGMVIPAIPLLATTFEVSVGVAAQVVTAHMLGRTFSLIPAGMVVDRMGRRPAMVMGPLLIATGALVTAFAPQFSLLLVAQFVAGAGNSLWMLGREVAAVDLVRADQRGRMMSGFFGISSVGMTLGPAIGGLITDWLGLRAIFLVYTVLALLVLPVALTVRESRGQRPGRRAPLFDFGLGRIREIAPGYRATFVILLMATFAAMLRTSALNSMLPLYVGTHLDFSTAQVGTLFGIVGFVNMAMIAPAGFVSDKLGRKVATVPAAALTAIAFAAYPLATTMLSLSIVSGITGLAGGFALGSMTTSTYDIVPESGRAQLQALRRTVGELGALGGPLAGGVIANVYNPGVSFLFFAPLHLLTALLLVLVAKETLITRQRTPAAEEASR